jgi:hypothetical protein
MGGVRPVWRSFERRQKVMSWQLYVVLCHADVTVRKKLFRFPGSRQYLLLFHLKECCEHGSTACSATTAQGSGRGCQCRAGTAQFSHRFVHFGADCRSAADTQYAHGTNTSNQTVSAGCYCRYGIAIWCIHIVTSSEAAG